MSPSSLRSSASAARFQIPESCLFLSHFVRSVHSLVLRSKTIYFVIFDFIRGWATCAIAWRLHVLVLVTFRLFEFWSSIRQPNETNETQATIVKCAFDVLVAVRSLCECVEWCFFFRQVNGRLHAKILANKRMKRTEKKNTFFRFKREIVFLCFVWRDACNVLSQLTLKKKKENEFFLGTKNFILILNNLTKIHFGTTHHTKPHNHFTVEKRKVFLQWKNENKPEHYYSNNAVNSLSQWKSDFRLDKIRNWWWSWYGKVFSCVRRFVSRRTWHKPFNTLIDSNIFKSEKQWKRWNTTFTVVSCAMLASGWAEVLHKAQTFLLTQTRYHRLSLCVCFWRHVESQKWLLYAWRACRFIFQHCRLTFRSRH